METHDYNIVRNLTYFPCITAGKDGIRNVDEPTFKSMFESGENVQWKVLDISDIQTQTIDNSAVIAYQIEIESTHDGKKSSLKCACTSTWAKENSLLRALSKQTSNQKTLEILANYSGSKRVRNIAKERIKTASDKG